MKIADVELSFDKREHQISCEENLQFKLSVSKLLIYITWVIAFLYLSNIVGKGNSKVEIGIRSAEDDPQVPKNGSKNGACDDGARNHQNTLHV